jgi:hypothetical protein
MCPKEDRRRFMVQAYDLDMAGGDYVFYTVDMLPEEENLNVDETWLGKDGRDEEAKLAFEAVFHVSQG